MALFTSHDGVDRQGVRAEVNVQVGTGRIKEIVGKPNADGVSRNVEVVFDPDNPKLKRKVYALLDTGATDLLAYVEAAHADQRTVSYRIESQRKRGVDRTIPYAELTHTEDAVRILAAVDDVFSHEAKTDPMEDPDHDGAHPSALAQRLNGDSAASASGGQVPSAAVSLEAVTDMWRLAKDAGMSQGVLDAMAAQALALGGDFETFASKDMFGSPPVLAAAAAEQFALDHLVEFYSQPATVHSNPRNIVVVDQMFAQAAALAVELLAVTDQVQVAAGLSAPNRFAGSYRVALDLVCDCVEKRHAFPLGKSSSVVRVWRQEVIAEAAERLQGVAQVAQGVVPHRLVVDDAAEAAPDEAVKAAPSKRARKPRSTAQSPTPEPVAEPAVEPVAEPAVEPVMDAHDVAAALGAELEPEPMPQPDDPNFEAPDDALVNRLRVLCQAAGVTNNLPAISRWLQASTGHRVAKEIHAPRLAALVSSYESASPEALREDVLSHAA